MVDFSECEYIYEQMKYYTFDDFFKERKYIKKQYEELNKNGKRFYMWYVYANIHMGINKKNLIWDYLNGYKDDSQLMLNKKEN